MAYRMTDNLDGRHRSRTKTNNAHKTTIAKGMKQGPAKCLDPWMKKTLHCIHDSPPSSFSRYSFICLYLFLGRFLVTKRTHHQL